MSSSLRMLAAGTLFAAAATFAAAPRISYAATPTAASTSNKAPTKARTPQQQRMADCSHQAKVEGRKGPERRTFMSTCLRGPHSAKAKASSPHKTEAEPATKASTKG